MSCRLHLQAVEAMTHDASKIGNPCRENVSYVSCPSQNPENVSCNGMTHDTYDTYLDDSTHARIRKTKARKPVMRHMRHAVTS